MFIKIGNLPQMWMNIIGVNIMKHVNPPPSPPQKKKTQAFCWCSRFALCRLQSNRSNVPNVHTTCPGVPAFSYINLGEAEKKKRWCRTHPSRLHSSLPECSTARKNHWILSTRAGIAFRSHSFSMFFPKLTELGNDKISQQLWSTGGIGWWFPLDWPLLVNRSLQVFVPLTKGGRKEQLRITKSAKITWAGVKSKTLKIQYHYRLIVGSYMHPPQLRYQKWWFGKCVSFQTWLFWVLIR